MACSLALVALTCAPAWGNTEGHAATDLEAPRSAATNPPAESVPVQAIGNGVANRIAGSVAFGVGTFQLVTGAALLPFRKRARVYTLAVGLVAAGLGVQEMSTPVGKWTPTRAGVYFFDTHAPAAVRDAVHRTFKRVGSRVTSTAPRLRFVARVR